MQKIRLLVVDDHNVVRGGLLALLTAEPDLEIVGEATSGRQAVALAHSLRPQVVIMDLAMPRLNGMEATRQIASSLPSTKVIVLSAYQDDYHVRQAVVAGAAGFVLKRAASVELVEAIREVHRGEAYFSAAVMRQVQRMYSALNELSETDNSAADVELTGREAEVLQLVAEGFPSKLIADELGLSIKTVEKHRQTLMDKLNLHCTADLVRYAANKGIIEAVSLERVLTTA